MPMKGPQLAQDPSAIRNVNLVIAWLSEQGLSTFLFPFRSMILLIHCDTLACVAELAKAPLGPPALSPMSELMLCH